MMRALDRLLAERTSARALAVARIGVGVAVLMELLTSGAALLQVAQDGRLAAPYVPGMPPTSPVLAMGLVAAWALAGIGLLVGWHTRMVGGLLTVTLALVLGLDQQLYSNHLYLMVLVVGLLTLADSGAAISADARRSGGRDSVAKWPVWLLRVQVSLVYGYAALSKINLPFLSGTVIATSLRRDGPLAVPDGWRVAEAMLVLAVLTIFVEAFVAIGLWVPRWRQAAFVVGLGLHIGISAWLSPSYQLLVFSVLMLPLYVLFIPLPAEAVRVVWDDGCGFCGRWVTWFRRLDWLHALEFIPISRLSQASLPVTIEEASQALQLVTERRTYAGYRAVTQVASRLPLCFLWAPLLRLPFVAAVGDRVYRRVAERRLCAVSES